ncbi:MAG TPA: LegC family aminotransferase [Tenuifilaceae bacterium]|nr:LegC family aminotransferase [Tenuifilaceae bacterium]HPN22259.1 LegC family aminotransferase [Tenuifilaceae bacterium]
MDSNFSNVLKFIRELYSTPAGFIPLHAPVFSGNEKAYLNECIDTTFVSSVGKFVDTFEQEMAKFTGSARAVSCVNGTNALHLALKLVGVEQETEVLTQPLTFIATANAISYCGARPVFIDVDIDTLGLSPVALKKWLEENTVLLKNGQCPINKSTGKHITACVPMHTFGHPCRIEEIVEICNTYNIPVVEDAAESLGSYYKGKHTGNFGKVGVLSFNGNKVLTTGGGGMLLFNDEQLAAKAKHLTTQAKVPHPWEFNHDAVGFNYRMPNINAALGLAQLEQLPKFLESKRNIAEAYKLFFSEFKSVDINFVVEPTNSKSNYWLNSVLLGSKGERDEFLRYSNENGVMTRPVWTLMNKLPMFSDAQCGDLKNAEHIEDGLVNLPSSVIK